MKISLNIFTNSAGMSTKEDVVDILRLLAEQFEAVPMQAVDLVVSDRNGVRVGRLVVSAETISTH